MLELVVFFLGFLKMTHRVIFKDDTQSAHASAAQLVMSG